MAIDSLRQAIGRNPNQPPLYFNLTRAHYDQGDLSRSQETYRHYLEVQPHDEDALLGLVRVYQDNGELESAIRYYHRALQLNPAKFDALNSMGLAYHSLGRYPEALECFGRALRLQPEDCIVLLNLGDTYLETGNLLQTKKCYQLTLSYDENNIEALLGIADILRNSGSLDGASQYYDRILGLEPDNPAAHFLLGDIFERRGEKEPALSHSDIAARNGYPENECKILRAKIQLRNNLIEESIDLLTSIGGREDNSEYVQCMKYFLLGKCYDRKGMPDQAIECFQTGNAIQSRSMSAKEIREDTHLEKIEKNTRVFTKELVSDWPKYPGEEEPPVFLVGFPRSGTTLLDQILDSHPDLTVLEEVPVIEELIAHITEHFGSYPEIVGALAGDQLNELRAKYFLKVANKLPEQPAGPVIVDKFPLNIVHLGLIQRIFPNAKIIFVLRHPFDVCLSNFMQVFGLNQAMKHFLTLPGTARVYRKVMDLWFQSREVLSLQIHQIRYEDLVEDLETEARGLFRFLNVSWDPVVLEFYRHAQKRVQIGTPIYQDVMQSIFQRAKYRWKKYKKHLVPVQSQLEKYVTAFGYEFD